jgi:hypothetical protein
MEPPILIFLWVSNSLNFSFFETEGAVDSEAVVEEEVAVDSEAVVVAEAVGGE